MERVRVEPSMVGAQVGVEVEVEPKLWNAPRRVAVNKNQK
jgi:hypothetical protein